MASLAKVAAAPRSTFLIGREETGCLVVTAVLEGSGALKPPTDFSGESKLSESLYSSLLFLCLGDGASPSLSKRSPSSLQQLKSIQLEN